MSEIKAVLFDMDGVLIDAKDWHYEALNSALRHFGMEISRDEHLSIYDGLPTRKKLEILTRARRLPQKLHGFLNDLKQQYTVALTTERCRPMFHHQMALSQLKRDGYKLAVCSNSIRRTVELMMELSKLSEYLDFTLSNEDVPKPKPAPDIYDAAIKRLGLEPHECLIVEDNDHGIAAARASGAHVLVVGTVYDVNYERIAKAIREAESAR
ncbi:HAD family phosphatase [Caulobacter sp. 602-2]|uniref:HAD family phosphatase n=1 Tax=Caulobacter sp. 602-2 TaxID=2710887 RepID=A0A6G4QXH9_9CAUL|nr:HAD family phosphatase [Caulobacter sp. 602-2]NGM50242.1 HAD family phosphatase [Caulobacter sp. 602-2]